MTDHELEIGPGISNRELYTELIDAIDLASDQDQSTWLTSAGKRVARIVTVEDGERLDRLDRKRLFGDLPRDEQMALARKAMAQIGQELSSPAFQAAMDATDAMLNEDEPEPPDTLQELREPD